MIAFAAALLAALGVAGCDSDVGTSPYPAPTDYAIQGIDVSKYQGDVDWNAVAGSGVRFAYIKATEGGDYLDEKFRQNWELSRASGIARGAYHFAYWCRSAQEQAAWFLANVPNDPSAMPPVLDVEWNPQSRTCPRKLPREQALAMMRTILSAMEQAYGKRPVIYTSVDFPPRRAAGRVPRLPDVGAQREGVPLGAIRRSPLEFLAAYRDRLGARRARLRRSQLLLRQPRRLAELAPQPGVTLLLAKATKTP